ncbi:MAG: RNA polymerase sigma factor [Bacteroidota bacterium]
MEPDITSAEAERNSERILQVAHKERPRLLSFVRKQVASQEDAEDILQDVFLRLLVASSVTEPIEHVTAWMFRTARNRVIDWYRRKRHSAVPMTEIESSEEPAAEYLFADLNRDPASELLGSMIWDEVNDALDDLPAPQRLVFIAHEIDGKSFNEIAAETGDPVNTLISRKRYAVLFLRERLQEFYSELFEE